MTSQVQSSGLLAQPRDGLRGVMVRLTPGDVARARMIAMQRTLASSIMHGRKPRYGPVANGDLQYGYELEGVLGELAVSRILNCWPSGLLVVGERLPQDDGGYEVKATTNPKARSLIVQKGTRPDLPVVLTIPEPGGEFVRVVGWIWSRDAQDPKYWREGARIKNPAYFVPQEDLPATPSQLVLWWRDHAYNELASRYYECRGLGA